jgi:hypothetical protein
MFDYRSDKAGFFVTIIMLVWLGAAIVGSVVALLLGQWDDHVLILKWVWGTWWVLCIVTVLTRLAIFRWQMGRFGSKESRARQTDELSQDKEPSSPS